MTDTYCKQCVFTNVNNQECLFDIPSYLSSDRIEKKDGFNLIKNYKCHYGTDKSSFGDGGFSIEDLKKYSVSKNTLKYYLFIDATSDKTYNIDNILDYINNLDIKPKFLSLLLNGLTVDPVDFHNISKIFTQKIDKSINWKLHYWLNNDTLLRSIHTILSTNIESNNTNCILYFRPTGDNSGDYETLNQRVNFLQISQLVKQDYAHVVLDDLTELDGLFIPNIVYKEIMEESDKDKNILSIIKNISEKKLGFKILYYEYKSKN